MPPYVLQVLRCLQQTKQHVGYLNKWFSTMEEAADYYDAHNAHMRGLHAHGHWVSDWDPDTLLQSGGGLTTGS